MGGSFGGEGDDKYETIEVEGLSMGTTLGNHGVSQLYRRPMLECGLLSLKCLSLELIPCSSWNSPHAIQIVLVLKDLERPVAFSISCTCRHEITFFGIGSILLCFFFLVTIEMALW